MNARPQALTNDGKRRFALATSGLGSSSGGIGVVSSQIANALGPLTKLSVWRYPHQCSRITRIGRYWVTATWSSLRVKPSFVLYEHVDLARFHPLTPGLKQVPYGIFLHGVEVWRVLDPRRRRAIEGARLLLANSSYTVRLARQDNPWLPEVQTAWLGISDTPNDQPAPSIGPFALMVGRMDAGERYKGHDAVLDAWRTVRQAVPSATLWIVGTGNDRGRLQKRVEDEHLEGVEFRGWVDDKERSRLYQSCQLFLFPSRREGFGLVAVEAAAAGKPALTLKGSVLEEVFPEGTGFVHVEEQTGPAIAKAMIPLLEDPQLAATQGNAALQRMRENFREEHFARRLLQILRPHLSLPAES